MDCVPCQDGGCATAALPVTCPGSSSFQPSLHFRSPPCSLNPAYNRLDTHTRTHTTTRASAQQARAPGAQTTLCMCDLRSNEQEEVHKRLQRLHNIV